MKKERTKKDKLLDVARKMPPVYHKILGESFGWGKSEVMKWLVEQPEILNFLWQSIANKNGGYGGKMLIQYNPETGKWQGVDYNGEN